MKNSNFKTSNKDLSQVRRGCALFLCLCLLFSPAPLHAQVAKDYSKTSIVETGDQSATVSAARISIPKELGVIDEFHQGTSDQMVIYIQDAHDSFEVQENIAKIIDYLVGEYGIKKVFEEGYEGKVPTDEFFSFLKDSQAKKKVSYFLMDQLRLHGAEYAHINRTKNFELFGVDSLELHQENIDWYKKSSETREAVNEDLESIQKRIEVLAHTYFPKELKNWIKLKDRLNNHQISLLDYLNRMAANTEIAYPALDLFRTSASSADKARLKKLENIDFKQIFEDLNNFENDYANTYLTNPRDQKLYRIHKSLNLLKRLNRIEVTPEEFDLCQKALKDINTKKVSEFLFELTGKRIILSNLWEKYIPYALRFYEAAHRRDAVLEKSLLEQKDSLDTAILVYGGFHKNRIKQTLQKNDFSYVVVTPKMTEPSKRHQDYYKQLMAGAYHVYEVPIMAARAAPTETILELMPANRFPSYVAQLPAQISQDPFVAPLLALSETRSLDFHEIDSAAVQRDIKSILGNLAGVSLQRVESAVIREPSELGATLKSPFGHDGAAPSFLMSALETVGSFTFMGPYDDLTEGLDGQATRQFTNDMKVIGDGTAVYMGFVSLLSYSARHEDEAFLILGDEGARDESISLSVGSIFYKGQVIKFYNEDSVGIDFPSLYAFIENELFNKGVKLRGVLGDALEVTNAFVLGQENSWSMTGVVSLPQTMEDLKKVHLVPDGLRLAGWVYRADREAETLTPYTEPQEGFRLIAQANNINPDDGSSAFAEWMARHRQITLGEEHKKPGTRPFLQPAREQGRDLESAFPGFKMVEPYDGDAAPMQFAAAGLDVNGQTYVGRSREGDIEGTVTMLAANNAGAYFTFTFVSAHGTQKAAELTAANAKDFSQMADRAGSEQLEIRQLGITEEQLQRTFTRENWPHKGVITMTSVTGASQDLFGDLSRSLRKAVIIPDETGEGGQIILHSYMMVQDGTVYILRSTFQADKLTNAINRIKLASRVPQPIPLPETQPKLIRRTLGQMTGVVAKANESSVTGSEAELFTTRTYAHDEHLAEALRKNRIAYRTISLEPKIIGEGTLSEYGRTIGYFNNVSQAQLVEIYDGRGQVLMWKMTPGSATQVEDSVLLDVRMNDKFFIPAGWGVVFSNLASEHHFRYAVWFDRNSSPDTLPVTNVGGPPWFSGPYGVFRNPKYTALQLPNIRRINYDALSALGVDRDKSVWTIAQMDAARFERILKLIKSESASDEMRVSQLFQPRSEVREGSRALELNISRVKVKAVEGVYTIPIDIHAWTYGWTEIQRREVEALLEASVQGDKIEVVVNDIRATTTDPKIRTHYQRLQGLPNIRFVKSSELFNPRGRQVVAIRKEGMASEWISTLQNRWEKQDFFHPIMINALEASPGKVTTAIMLLESGQEAILREKSVFEQFVDANRNNVIAQLIMTYEYTGRSA